MPGWSINPFWEDEIEDSLRTTFDKPPTPASSQSILQQAGTELASSTSKKTTDKKKSTSTEPAKKRAPKKSQTQSAPPKELALISSDSEEDAIPPTQPPVKRKRPARDLQSEEEASIGKAWKPVRAATLRSFLTQRGSSGYTTQRDPARTGEYYIELRVYNSREAERLPADERWKNALNTMKIATDSNTAVWKAVSKLIQAGKEDFANIQPIMYPSV